MKIVKCRVMGFMAHFCNSGGIPSGSAAQPFHSFLMAEVTSSKVDFSGMMPRLGGIEVDLDFRSLDRDPRRKLRAEGLCSCQCCKVLLIGTLGLLSALFTV